MKKILTFLSILFLLSSVVSAQDSAIGDTAPAPLAVLDGAPVYEENIAATLSANTDETKVLGTFTETTGQGPGTEYVTVYGEVAPGVWGIVQENAFTAPAGGSVDLTVTVNEVEITGDGQQIIIPDGETKTFYLTAQRNIIRLLVTNPAEAAPTPVSTGSGGIRVYTPEEEKKVEEIKETIGSLSLSFNQPDLAGQLNLFYRGGGKEPELEYILEFFVLTTINSNDLFSFFSSTISNDLDMDFDGLPDGEEEKQKNYDCNCEFSGMVAFSCRKGGEASWDNEYEDTIKKGPYAGQVEDLPGTTVTGENVVSITSTEHNSSEEGTVTLEHFGIQNADGSIDLLADGILNFEWSGNAGNCPPPDGDKKCKDQCTEKGKAKAKERFKQFLQITANYCKKGGGTFAPPVGEVFPEGKDPTFDFDAKAQCVVSEVGATPAAD